MFRPTRVLSGVLLCTAAFAGAATDYSPVVRTAHPSQVYWGDTHLHTSYSADAYTFENTTLTQEDAYRFARGERIESQFGLPVKLRVPLDFLVVTDHAEFMGVFRLLEARDEAFLTTRVGKYWRERIEAGDEDVVLQDFVTATSGGDWDYAIDTDTYVSVWDTVTRLADDYNEPGRFTTFAGYEWTSMPEGNNLHRVVLFKDGADKTATVIPFSAIDSADPEDLWAYLARYEKSTGGEALAIPHNPNVSNGLMFAPQRLAGGDIDGPYATLRARWEPVLEVTQFKGDSEAHPALSPTDEFADFENWDAANISNTSAKEPWMLRYEYARSALKMGLAYQHSVGANPFKFGMIGSTDSHTALATAAEDNWFGKFPVERPQPGRATSSLSTFYENWRLAASGYAAVWATANTRAAIFAALKRREVYATTGPRIVLRFFGGWDFERDDIHRPDMAAAGYAQGVPMGGDLWRTTAGGAPRFLVTAAKDPHGANLDRIQIVKGWLDQAGAAHEAVYNVALSDDRVVDPRTGKAPPVGNTVDVAAATYSNAIGAAQLVSFWEDPDFDPARPAFYYVRTLEIPTPRWTAYDARYFKLSLPEHVPMWQQERAYSSPIWYSPAGRTGQLRAQ